MEDLLDLILKRLGHTGRMIGGSKSGYMKKYPKNIAVFNANIILETEKKGLLGKQKYTKVWYGDLDITRDEDDLNDIAKEAGVTLLVLRESDARFENEKKPDVSNYIVKTNGIMVVGPNHKERYVRNDVAQLVRND